MQGDWLSQDFPNLDDTTCTVTSPPTMRYNCIAWAAKNNTRWWWPDPLGIAFWPLPNRELTMEAFVEVFQGLGYQICVDESLERGLEKIALYGKKEQDKLAIPTHAALQLDTGKWTSKIGGLQDIIHDTPDAAAGPLYGRTLIFMSRPRPEEQT